MAFVTSSESYLFRQGLGLEMALLQGLELFLEGCIGSLHLLTALLQSVCLFFDARCNACFFF